MKKLLALLLAVCALLCACTPAGGDTTPGTTEATTEATTETTTETTTVAIDPPVLYRNPLNGEPMEQAYAGRPVAVVVNNLKQALPQRGITKADFFYEIETEGGITRCLAVFSDITQVDDVGPIRSARTFFNNIAVSYDAPIAHCGGSVRGRNAGYEDSNDKIKNWAHLDQMGNGSYFYRDKDRRKNGYSLEHTLFSTGEDLLAGLTKRKIADATDRSTDFGLVFEDEVILNGAAATNIEITFRGGKETNLTYDADSGLYLLEQYGKKWIDENDDTQLTAKNVLILCTDQWKRDDGEYNRSYYDLEGTGDGFLAIDGKLVPIQWSRKDLHSSFVYTLADGAVVTLAAGSTYVAVVGDNKTPAKYS